MTHSPVVSSVSQATRPLGSSVRIASSTESLIWSAILSGWPSVTLSEVKVQRDIVILRRWVLVSGWGGRSGVDGLVERLVPVHRGILGGSGCCTSVHWILSAAISSKPMLSGLRDTEDTCGGTMWPSPSPRWLK